MKKEDVPSKEMAYEIVFKKHVNDIYRVCLYFLRNEDKAADITEKVFFNYYLQFDEEKQDDNLKPLMKETKILLAKELGIKIKKE